MINNLDAGQALELTPQQAFLAISMAASAIDDEISQIEHDIARVYTSSNVLFKDYSTVEFVTISNDVMELLSSDQYSIDDILKAAAKVLEPPFTNIAFAAALHIAYADGGIEDAELEFVQKLNNILNIGKREADQIHYVMRLINSANIQQD